MPRISMTIARALQERTGEESLDRAAGIVLRELARNEQMLRQFEQAVLDMQVRVEASDQDAGRTRQSFLDHVARVRDLLGDDTAGEDDVYERIRKLKVWRVLAQFVMQQLSYDVLPTHEIMTQIDKNADAIATMHTRNAQLFRENVRLMQEVEKLRAGEESDPAV